jgi:hypothetical protein
MQQITMNSSLPPKHISNSSDHRMIFFFTKVNDLIFYAIMHFVSLTLIDDTFKVLSLTTP